MNPAIKVNDDGSKGVTFHGAQTVLWNGRVAAQAIVSVTNEPTFAEALCSIETPDELLDNGIAICLPVDPKLASQWPIFLVLRRPGKNERVAGATRDLRVVAAAKRFSGMVAKAACMEKPELVLREGLIL